MWKIDGLYDIFYEYPTLLSQSQNGADKDANEDSVHDLKFFSTLQEIKREEIASKWVIKKETFANNLYHYGMLLLVCMGIWSFENFNKYWKYL